MMATRVRMAIGLASKIVSLGLIQNRAYGTNATFKTTQTYLKGLRSSTLSTFDA